METVKFIQTINITFKSGEEIKCKVIKNLTGIDEQMKKKHNIICAFPAKDGHGRREVIIQVGDKFFSLSKETRCFLLRHEVAHVMAEDIVSMTDYVSPRYTYYLEDAQQLDKRADAIVLLHSAWGKKNLNEKVIENIFYELSNIDGMDTKKLEKRRNSLFNIYFKQIIGGEK